MMRKTNSEETLDELRKLREKCQNTSRDRIPMYITNVEFCSIFNVSTTTALRLRQKGSVTFLKEGAKVVYPFDTLVNELKTGKLRIKAFTRQEALERLIAYRKQLELYI